MTRCKSIEQTLYVPKSCNPSVLRADDQGIARNNQVFTRLVRSRPSNYCPLQRISCVRSFVFSTARRQQGVALATALTKLAYSRRVTPRLETTGDVWVFWRCQGMDDVSRVCDLSLGGLFISTAVTPPLGAKAKLEFLIQEGQIRAEAVVRHLIPGGGLGLKFTAITDKDCPQMVALLNRIRALSSAKGASFPAQQD
jgi:hypothetical protein